MQLKRKIPYLNPNFWFILIVSISLTSYLIKAANEYPKNPTIKPGSKTYSFNYFSVAPPDKWDLDSYHEEPEVEGETATFSQRLGNHQLISVYIYISNNKPNKEPNIPKINIKFMGKMAEKYVFIDCGGGKAMGSFCEDLIFNHNDRWYSLSLIDYGSRIGRFKDERLFNEFVSSLKLL